MVSFLKWGVEVIVNPFATALAVRPYVIVMPGPVRPWAFVPLSPVLPSNGMKQGAYECFVWSSDPSRDADWQTDDMHYALGKVHQ